MAIKKKEQPDAEQTELVAPKSWEVTVKIVYPKYAMQWHPDSLRPGGRGVRRKAMVEMDYNLLQSKIESRLLKCFKGIKVILETTDEPVSTIAGLKMSVSFSAWGVSLKSNKEAYGQILDDMVREQFREVWQLWWSYIESPIFCEDGTVKDGHELKELLKMKSISETEATEKKIRIKKEKKESKPKIFRH
jgi:hypothetical protein